MKIRELCLDIDSHVLADVEQWQRIYDSMPNLTKVTVVGWSACRRNNGPQRDLPTHCLAALSVVQDNLLCAPNLAELQVIFGAQVSEAILSAAVLTQCRRRDLGYPIDKVTFGILPPSTLSEDDTQRIMDLFGPDSVVGTQESYFDVSPFSADRFEFSSHFFPEPFGRRGACGHTCCSCREFGMKVSN